MKIVDEKGRLFGKINLVDFLLILFLIGITPAFYFVYKVFIKRDKTAITLPLEFINLEMKCSLVKLDPKLLKKISVGDKQLDSSGFRVGEIVWLGEVKPYQHKFDLGVGLYISKEDPVLRQMEARLNLRVRIDGNNLYYNSDRPISPGELIEFNTSEYAIKVKPYFEKEKKPEKRVRVTVKFTGIMPELGKIISEGDIETDTDGRVVGKLKKIISKSPSTMLSFSMREDRYITVSEPSGSLDIVVSFDLTCTEKEGVLYFNNIPVKIGNSITFVAELYSVSGTVTGMKIE